MPLGRLLLGAVVVGVVVLPLADGFDRGASADNVRVQNEVPVTPMDRSVRPSYNSPELVVDPEDAHFVLLANRSDAPGFGCGLQVSGDGGRGWISADPLPELPEGAHSCYAPEVAFGPDGILYFLFVGLAGAGNQPMGVFLSTSEDRGRTFGQPRQILDELKFGVRMGVDPDTGPRGRMHLVWIEATSEPGLGSFGPPPNPVMAAYSNDGGQSFSEPVQVSDPDRERVVGPALALGPDGRVHVAYYDLGDDARDYQGLEGPVWPGTWEVVLATSADGGATFAPGVAVDAAVVPHERVMVVFTMPPPALVAADGRVCVAWTDARHGSADVLASCAATANGWGEPVRVNDDPIDQERTQDLPQLSLAPGGRLDVIFYDRRHSSNDLNSHVFFSYSTDGGRSFAPNIQVTTHPSFTQIGQQYAIPSAEGLVEFGGRLGLLSTTTGAVAAWADTRNSDPPSTAQDIFAAILVELPDAGGSTGMRRAVGVAVGVSGLLALLSLAVIARRRRRVRRPGADAGGSA